MISTLLRNARECLLYAVTRGGMTHDEWVDSAKRLPYTIERRTTPALIRHQYVRPARYRMPSSM